MKNRRKLVYITGAAIIAALPFFLFNGGDSSSKAEKNLGPEAVVENFTSAMKEGNFDKAENLCTADTMKVYMDAYKQKWEELKEANGEAFEETVKVLAGTEIHFEGMQEIDGMCMVDYTLEMNGVQKKHQATLRKEEGEWKVVKITDKN